jgi:hypothetical protein
MTLHVTGLLRLHSHLAPTDLLSILSRRFLIYQTTPIDLFRDNMETIEFIAT